MCCTIVSNPPQRNYSLANKAPLHVKLYNQRVSNYKRGTQDNYKKNWFYDYVRYLWNVEIETEEHVAQTRMTRWSVHKTKIDCLIALNSGQFFSQKEFQLKIKKRFSRETTPVLMILQSFRSFKGN